MRSPHEGVDPVLQTTYSLCTGAVCGSVIGVSADEGAFSGCEKRVS